MRAVALALIVAVSCTNGPVDDRPVVAAAFDLLGSVAVRLGGDAVRVAVLTPPGAEPHDVELGPDEVEAALDAALLITLSGFQPAVDRVAENRTGAWLELGRPPGTADLHIWLDPLTMIKLVTDIGNALATVLPEERAAIEERTAGFELELENDLHRRFERRLAGCELDTFVTAHAAFGPLAARYELTQEALALVPDAEPAPARVDELVSLVRDRGIQTVFAEPGEPSAGIRTIARETGATVGILDPIERMEPGEDYVAVMERNLTALAAALRC